MFIIVLGNWEYTIKQDIHAWQILLLFVEIVENIVHFVQYTILFCKINLYECFLTCFDALIYQLNQYPANI